MIDKNYLPSDGSIVIIDDNINEVIPFFQILSQRGIAFTYYNGAEKYIPTTPQQKIRLVFLDIQLVPQLNPHQYAQNILQLLSRLIPQDNGPYIALIWSKREPIYFETVKTQLLNSEFPIKPVFILKLNKRDYIKEKEPVIIENILEQAKELLTTRFDKDDIKFIEQTFNSIYKNNTAYEISVPDIRKIENKLEKELKKANVFHLFTIWERAIYKSTKKSISAITNVFEYNDDWQKNIRHLLYVMARAIVAKNLRIVSNAELLKSAISILNQTYTENINSGFFKEINVAKYGFLSKYDNHSHFIVDSRKIKISSLANGKFSVYIDGINKNSNKDFEKLQNVPNQDEKLLIEKATSIYNKQVPTINTILHFDNNVNTKILPGTIFQRKVDGRKHRSFLSSYFKSEPTSKVIKQRSTTELKDIKFIELELTPICDFAQDKYFRNRFVSGIIFPASFFKRADVINNFKSEYFYLIDFEFQLELNLYRMALDFRRLKTIDKKETAVKYNTPLFKLKTELFTDIITKLSRYMNRPGVTYLT